MTEDPNGRTALSLQPFAVRSVQLWETHFDRVSTVCACDRLCDLLYISATVVLNFDALMKRSRICQRTRVEPALSVCHECSELKQKPGEPLLCRLLKQCTQYFNLRCRLLGYLTSECTLRFCAFDNAECSNTVFNNSHRAFGEKKTTKQHDRTCLVPSW